MEELLELNNLNIKVCLTEATQNPNVSWKYNEDILTEKVVGSKEIKAGEVLWVLACRPFQESSAPHYIVFGTIKDRLT